MNPLDGLKMTGVDQVDDLQMPRQNPLEHRHRPAFERLGQQRVVRVPAGVDGDLPGVVPRDVVEIDENSHQLGDYDARVCVIELDGGPLREGVERAVSAAMALDKVLQRSGNKEILLAQAQLSPGGGLVAWIEDLGERLGAHLFAQRAEMVAAVEDLEPDRIDGAGRP